MKVLRTIPTPWHPYSVMFSRDGSRLAVGGGSWYGHGGILLMRLDAEQREMLRWDGIPGVTPDDVGGLASTPTSVPTVSGICFSDDDRFLAASMWSFRQHYAPTILFEVNDLTLRAREQFTTGGDDVLRSLPCPTGVLLHGPHIITRQHWITCTENETIVVNPLPIESPIPWIGDKQHLTHSRIIVVRENAVTAADGPGKLIRRLPDGDIGSIAAPEGLVQRDLNMPNAVPKTIRVDECPRVTAIGALPGNENFATGGARGELDVWTWRGEWHQNRVRPPGRKSDPRLGDQIFYREESIAGIVAPARSQFLVAVTTGGKLITWSSDGVEEVWELPERGSPRSLAAHPDKPWIAVGIKQGNFANPESVVVIVDLE